MKLTYKIEKSNEPPIFEGGNYYNWWQFVILNGEKKQIYSSGFNYQLEAVAKYYAEQWCIKYINEQLKNVQSTKENN